MTDLDVAASLTLAELSGVGAVGYARLTRQFGSARAVLDADPGRLMAEGKVREPLARAISRAQGGDPVRRCLDWVERLGGRVVPLESPEYPALLHEIPDPPPVLYVKGDIACADAPAVAVVGSRHMSPYGRQVAWTLCRDFARVGMTVVSGMARGVDGEAHKAALEAGGGTVAVLGTGLDRPYPPEHVGLFRRIAETGAVISEYPPGTRPLGANFPRRNRIISGLSRGVVVVEAREGSGSLITARLAADQGRMVYAVPGRLDHPGARGSHALIRDGATLIRDAADVVADLLPQLIDRLVPAREAGAAAAPAPEGLAGRILGALTADPLTVDALGERLQSDPATLLGALLEMELGGLVEKLPGNQYIRSPRTL